MIAPDSLVQSPRCMQRGKKNFCSDSVEYHIVQNIRGTKFLWFDHLDSICRKKFRGCDHHLHKIVLLYRQFAEKTFADKHQIAKTMH